MHNDSVPHEATCTLALLKGSIEFLVLMYTSLYFYKMNIKINKLDLPEFGLKRVFPFIQKACFAFLLIEPRISYFIWRHLDLDLHLSVLVSRVRCLCTNPNCAAVLIFLTLNCFQSERTGSWGNLLEHLRISDSRKSYVSVWRFDILY